MYCAYKKLKRNTHIITNIKFPFIHLMKKNYYKPINFFSFIYYMKFKPLEMEKERNNQKQRKPDLEDGREEY